jgi:hypothetical protein
VEYFSSPGNLKAEAWSEWAWVTMDGYGASPEVGSRETPSPAYSTTMPPCLLTERAIKPGSG